MTDHPTEDTTERCLRAVALTYTDGACDLECPLCDCDGMQPLYAHHAVRDVFAVLGLSIGDTDWYTDGSTGSLPPIARTYGRTD